MKIFDIISTICTLISVVSAYKSWKFSKRTKSMLNRDSLIMVINTFPEIKNNLNSIRKFKNVSLPGNLKRGQNIELKINEQIEELKNNISLIHTNVPVIYHDIFTIGETNFLIINQTIAHMLGNHSEISDDGLDNLEKYFIELEVKLKKASETETDKI